MRTSRQRVNRPAWQMNWGRMMSALATVVVLALIVGVGQTAAVSQEGSPLYPLRQALADRYGGMWQTLEGQVEPIAAKTAVLSAERVPLVQPGRGDSVGSARAFETAVATADGAHPRFSLALSAGVTQIMSRAQNQHRFLAGVAAGPDDEWTPETIRLRDPDRDGSGDGQSACFQVGRQSQGNSAGRLNPDRVVAWGHDLHAGGLASNGGNQDPHGSADTGSPVNGGAGEGEQGNVAGSEHGAGGTDSDIGGTEGGQEASGGGRSPSSHGGSGGNSQHGGSGHGGH